MQYFSWQAFLATIFTMVDISRASFSNLPQRTKERLLKEIQKFIYFFKWTQTRRIFRPSNVILKHSSMLLLQGFLGFGIWLACWKYTRWELEGTLMQLYLWYMAGKDKYLKWWLSRRTALAAWQIIMTTVENLCNCHWNMTPNHLHSYIHVLILYQSVFTATETFNSVRLL